MPRNKGDEEGCAAAVIDGGEMKNTEPRGDAYAAVRMIYDKSPGRSWRRLNGALQDTLTAAITAHLSFLPDDFAAICHDMNGGYWMGNSEGSTTGEGFYNLAVKVGHTPACISFERYAGRPAALWAESVKTPERLRIGSEFTWKGARVTVTSMGADHLTACTYHGRRYSNDDRLAIGSYEHLGDGKYRQIESIGQLENGSLTLQFSAPLDAPYSVKVKTITRILYADLAAVRKEFDTARRRALGAIAAAQTEQALVEVMAGIASNPAGTYRHFDIEDIRNAGRDRKRAIEDAASRKVEADRREQYLQERAASYAADLEDWTNGADARQWFCDVRVRVKGGSVETSTGQSASVENVRRVLPVVLRSRSYRGRMTNLSVGSYPVEELNDLGVKVGCTLIPWGEVDRLAGILPVGCGAEI